MSSWLPEEDGFQSAVKQVRGNVHYVWMSLALIFTGRCKRQIRCRTVITTSVIFTRCQRVTPKICLKLTTNDVYWDVHQRRVFYLKTCRTNYVVRIYYDRNNNSHNTTKLLLSIVHCKRLRNDGRINNKKHCQVHTRRLTVKQLLKCKISYRKKEKYV